MFAIPEVNCPALENVVHIQYAEGATSMYDSVVNVTCQRGYKFADGDKYKIYRCLATENWNDTLNNDTCESKTIVFHFIKYGYCCCLMARNSGHI